MDRDGKVFGKVNHRTETMDGSKGVVRSERFDHEPEVCSPSTSQETKAVNVLDRIMSQIPPQMEKALMVIFLRP